ncbi:MAG: hypothetical protein ACJ75S_08575 [Solirubrobacterales bacterium]
MTAKPRSSRLSLEVDPLTIALGLLGMSLLFGIFTLVNAIDDVHRRRRRLIAATAASEVLAAHTRLLADELFIAQVELQGELAAELDPEDEFWAELLGWSALLDPKPCQDCPQ